MKVYIESNFVLELALLQEQNESCENILSLCKSGKINLIIPAFCVAEPYETLGRRAKNRSKLAREVAVEFKQLSRSTPYKDGDEFNALQSVTGLLTRSAKEEELRLQQTLNQILERAQIIPLESKILIQAAKFRETLGLAPQDSIVYASIFQNLTISGSKETACFLNRNSSDFDDPDIVDTLSKYSCKVLFRFDTGFDYIKSQT